MCSRFCVTKSSLLVIIHPDFMTNHAREKRGGLGYSHANKKHEGGLVSHVTKMNEIMHTMSCQYHEYYIHCVQEEGLIA